MAKPFGFLLAVFKTLPRDVRALSRMLRLKTNLIKFQHKGWTISTAFDKKVEKDPKKVLLYFEDDTWTAERIQKFSYKIANQFLKCGYKKGQTVALFMPNCAEYTPIWVGLNRIGCITALVNPNLRQQTLKHCLRAVNCKAIIYSWELSDAIAEVRNDMIPQIAEYCLKSTAPSDKKDLLSILESVPECPPPTIAQSNSNSFFDDCLFIYTSGTTGLPKAARIKSSRVFQMASIGYYLGNLNPRDILYTTIPLYHASGILLGAGQMLVYNVPQVVRKQFSASQFWEDCVRYKVTAAQYIGEICRYLLAQPSTKEDNAHSIKVMFGNGLRPDIWQKFVERFSIPNIGEFYGSTEGNCGLANIDNTVGAVGFIPLWLPNFLPVKLAKVDEETGEFLRDPKTGFAILCKDNEPGEIIGQIQKHDRMSEIQEYTDKKATEEKIMRDMFKEGDTWFRSGDLLTKDGWGYYYFKDRQGDGFRWKGENCSASEIETAISKITGLDSVLVFGVEIPGCDGKAGMAVISDPENKLNLAHLAKGLSEELPSYGRPVFLRVTSTQLEVTESFKLKKLGYQQVGYDITRTRDKIFVMNVKEYVPLSSSVYETIVSGKVRL